MKLLYYWFDVQRCGMGLSAGPQTRIERRFFSLSLSLSSPPSTSFHIYYSIMYTSGSLRTVEISVSFLNGSNDAYKDQ